MFFSQKNLTIFSLLLIGCLFFPLVTLADRGMIPPQGVSLYETGQKAIVAWNGEEEILLLSTDIKSSQAAQVVEVIPLPSQPSIVEQGDEESFRIIERMVNQKWSQIQSNRQGLSEDKGAAAPGVEVTFHEKIGSHDITIVKVSKFDEFSSWVRGFYQGQGLSVQISSDFQKTVNDYLGRNLKFFVFDIVDVSPEEKSVKPILYKFKSSKFYYPLEITSAFSDEDYYSKLDLFLLTKEKIPSSPIYQAGLSARVFDYLIQLNHQELKEILEPLGDLFESGAYVAYAKYAGSLKKLDQDLVFEKEDKEEISGPEPEVLGKEEYYSVIFDGEGEAAVNAKLTLENIAEESNLNQVIVEIPGSQVRMIKAIQEMPVRSRRCRRWEAIPLETEGQTGKVQSSHRQCLEWYPYVSGPRYYTLKPDKEQLSKSVKFTFSLPESVIPQETASLLLYYKASGYAQKKGEVFPFNYETAKLSYDVQRARVAIDVQEGLYFEGGQAKTNYRPASPSYSLESTPFTSEGTPNELASKFSRQIQYAPGYIKETSGLDPFESFSVKGKYATSQFALEKWLIVGVAISFILVLGVIIFFIRWDIRRTKKSLEIET